MGTFSLNMILLFGIIFLALVLPSSVVRAAVEIIPSKVNEKIYKDMKGSMACFRMCNGTHQIGCSSSFGGDVGVLHLIDSTESLDWVTKNGPHPPYIAIMYPPYFNRRVLLSLRASKRVRGLLLLRPNETQAKFTSFSNEKTCPNQGYGYIRNPDDINSCPSWNPSGSGLLFEDWNFPIFFVSSASNVEDILKCYDDFNRPTATGEARDWPLCAAQLHSFMHSAVDTPTCIRRSNYFSINPTRVCDPLGDYNIWSTLVKRNHTEPYPENTNGSVIVIAARVDASTMFDKITPGSDSAGTGISTLIAIANHLKTLSLSTIGIGSDIQNIYFVLFNGEAFDYIGSSRMVYDMEKGQFPFEIKPNSTASFPANLRLQDIKYFIEVEQVSSSDAGGNYFVHSNPQAEDSAMQTLIAKFRENSIAQNLAVKFITSNNSTMGLPPSSIQSFLLHKSNLTGIVITNHEEKFRNPFYNSIFDNAINVGYVYKNKPSQTENDYPTDSIQYNIASLAATVANTVADLIDPISSRRPYIRDIRMADEILNCYIGTWKCQLFQNIMDFNVHQIAESEPFSLYVGVNRVRNDVTTSTLKVMTYLLGTIVPKTEEECVMNYDDMNVNYFWMNNSCYETTVTLSEAVSPAFLIEDYDMKSGVYSTWTESVWVKMSVRIFLKPSLTHELLTLLSGIVVFLLSIVIVGWVNSKSNLIFQTRGDLISS